MMMYKLSVIIPSYNRYPLNLWSLYSLENQTVNADDVEIIFIDDGSTDETASLSNFLSRYKFTYIKNSVNQGRSQSRNTGITKAKGEIILFLDAEMMVEPQFLQNHIDHHSNQQRLVVCGTFYHMGVFSMYYPQFSKPQVDHLVRLSSHHAISLPPSLRTCRKAVPIIQREDIDSLQFKKMSFSNPYFSEIAHAFGEELLGYQLPWTIFLSGNVSLRKDLLEATGGFDEGFKGWGYEDWELGYRLFKKGARIICKENIKAYHQEHPVPPNFIEQEMLPNFYVFQKKHCSFEVCIHALFILGLTSRIDEHSIVKEYNELVSEHPHRFNLLIDVFIHGLNRIASYLGTASPIPMSSDVLNNHVKLRNQKVEIIKINKFPNFINAYQLTLRKNRLNRL